MVTLNRLLALCLGAATLPAAAEEGLWTFDTFPAAAVQKAYGFTPSQAFLDAARLGTLKLNTCTAAFVSPDGLVVTNHHCVRTCVQDLSAPGRDYLQDGFQARTREQELRCDKLEALQLVELRDVTAQLQAATSGRVGTAFNDALDAATARLESSCTARADERCEVVNLFHGGRSQLHRYRRYTDLRLVFAPEFSVAAFGGDADNFNFPRYGLDVAFLRAWDPKARTPVESPHHFRWAKQGPQANEPLFVPGYPRATSRLASVAELEFERDVVLPYGLMQYAEMRATLRAFARASPDNERQVRTRLRWTENQYKVYRGAQQALIDDTFQQGSVFGQRRAAEARLRARAQKDPQLKAQIGSAWEDTTRALSAFSTFHAEYRLKELGEGFNTELGGIARHLVRLAEEREKPNAQRLREYTDARLPALETQLLRTTPISRAVEELALAVSLARMRELLGADDPFVQSVLGRETPEELARRVVRGTKLNDVAVRRSLLKGGKKALEASQDPMVLLARKVDPESRAVRTRYEDTVQAVLQKSGARLARAYFALNGNQGYPDANGSLRMTYGRLEGWQEAEHAVEPVTTFWGAYARHTGKAPFALPRTWLAAQEKVPTEAPLNFTSTHDITTGHSGAPLLNRDGALVGVVFDGNLHSLGDTYGYAAALNRAITMHGEGLMVALERIYGAGPLVKELRATQAK
jgi:hypothetical protein